MQVRLSLQERLLLETWLPRESELGQEQTDARSLVAMFQTLTPEATRDRLDKVRRHLHDGRSPQSLLDRRAPVGRGHEAVRGGALHWPSRWEDTWLSVDRLRTTGALDRIGATELVETLGGPLVNAVCMAMLCLDRPEDGVALAARFADDHPWIAWLGGNDRVELVLDNDTIGSTPKKALAAALAGDWVRFDKALPKSLSKPFPNVIKRSEDKRYGQLLVQLISHTRSGEPARDVVDRSLAVMFRYADQDNSWDGEDVVCRLPLLALYRRHCAPETSAAALLHGQRAHNDHLREPPARTYIGPAVVIAALEKLETILAAAVATNRGVTVQLGEENVYDLA